MHFYRGVSKRVDGKEREVFECVFVKLALQGNESLSSGDLTFRWDLDGESQ